MSFKFFEKDGELSISRGALPHWYQPGVTYFVTFRTEDSVPSDLVRAWHAERQAWLRWHRIDPSTGDLGNTLRRGRFWQEESFDDLVRNAKRFRRFQQYIVENPAKAGLPAGSFLLHSLPHWNLHWMSLRPQHAERASTYCHNFR